MLAQQVFKEGIDFIAGALQRSTNLASEFLERRENLFGEILHWVRDQPIFPTARGRNEFGQFNGRGKGSIDLSDSRICADDPLA
ncbi:hypothetical protein CO705_18215 [Ralstonia pickettii]|nr:hypothetical protein CO705_18215 [Ralstonia pickettii]